MSVKTLVNSKATKTVVHFYSDCSPSMNTLLEGVRTVKIADEVAIAKKFSAFGAKLVVEGEKKQYTRASARDTLLVETFECLANGTHLPDHTTDVSVFATNVSCLMSSRFDRLCPVCGNPEFKGQKDATGKITDNETCEKYTMALPSTKQNKAPKQIASRRCINCAIDVNNFVIRSPDQSASSSSTSSTDTSESRRLDSKSFADEYVARMSAFSSSYDRNRIGSSTDLGNVVAHFANKIAESSTLKLSDEDFVKVNHVMVLITDSEETHGSVRSSLCELMKINSAYGRNTVFPLITVVIGPDQPFFKEISNTTILMDSADKLDNAVKSLVDAISEAFSYTSPIDVFNEFSDKMMIATRSNGSKIYVNPSETVTVMMNPMNLIGDASDTSDEKKDAAASGTGAASTQHPGCDLTITLEDIKIAAPVIVTTVTSVSVVSISADQIRANLANRSRAISHASDTDSCYMAFGSWRR